MRILLVGEFSRLHNSLKEGLLALGHEVTIVASGDNFKQFPVDLSIDSKTISLTPFLKFLNKVSKKIVHFDLEKLEKGIRFNRLLPQLKNYDFVQLINSDAIETFENWEIKLYKKLIAQNTKSALLICGDETPIVDILLQKKLRYSVLTPYFENPKLKKYFDYTLNFASIKRRKVYDFLAQTCDVIIASDLDYKIALDHTKTSFHFIPNPINVDKKVFSELLVGDKICIFHGINKFSSFKKGSVFFEEALAIISEKYGDKVNIITANSLPYMEYEQLLNQAHIVLDQVYAFDQGYNALEAMAKGKVVFTGAEIEFKNHYKLSEKVAINALPNVAYLVNELSFLIENTDEIKAIGQRARKFIQQEHHYINVAEKYIEIWMKRKSEI